MLNLPNSFVLQINTKNDHYFARLAKNFAGFYGKSYDRLK